MASTLVMHSGTKYLCGHGDIIAGVIAGQRSAYPTRGALWHWSIWAYQWDHKKHIYCSAGWKLCRCGCRRIAKMPRKFAAFLASHPKVAKVYFPGLPSHLGHQVIADTASGFGGMVALDLAGGFADAARFLDNLNLFATSGEFRRFGKFGLSSGINHPCRDVSRGQSERQA